MPERTLLRLLVVDDDPAMGAMLRQLVRAQAATDPQVVTTGREALAAAGPFDIVLLDHQLPDTTGLEAIPALRARPGRPSIILITGNGDEALAAAALRQGADDYLIKDASLPKLLPQVLERVRRTRALRSALAAAEEDLVRAERLAAVGQLNVTLHHEINNPLMAAGVEIELLLQGTLDDETRCSLEAVRDALARIAGVLRRVGGLSQASARQYVGDVGMIDLQAPGAQPAGISPGEALLWVDENDTARIVALLLKHAGFSVRRVPDGETLAAEAETLGVSLVVICQPAQDKSPLAGFRPAVARAYAVVALVDGSGEAERAAGADHTVALPFDPGSFTEEILRAMEQGR